MKFNRYWVIGLGLFLLLQSVGVSAQMQIQNIEINQALGVQKGGTLKFVAGKDTVVRAFLSEAITIDENATSAQILLNGTEVAVLKPKSSAVPVNIVDFLCPSRETCGNWAAGTYVFNVKVNGVEKKEPPDSSTTISYIFQERKSVRVLALSVAANYNGTITHVPDDSWKKMWKFTSSVYPLAADKLKWVIRDEFDASAAKYNLETDDGQRNLWQALTDLMPGDCGANPTKEGCYDLIVGFISDRPKTYPNGTLQGFTYGKPTNIVVARDEDAPATVAHEIAHVYGIGDTYAGGSFRCAVNPAPDSFQGKDWDDGSKNVNCSASKVALGEVSATKIPADQHPYEIGGRGPLGDMACYMGSGGKQNQFWTTQETYDYLFDQLKPSTTVRRTLRSPQRLISFSGFVNDAGTVDVEPWESFMDISVVDDTFNGLYTITALDVNNAVLSSQNLGINFYPKAPPGQPIVKIDWAPFSGVMKFPDATTKFQIKKGDAVLKEMLVSANAPVISNVSPTTAGTSISGIYTIIWTASDADNDTLTYVVEYNPDVTLATSKWMTLIGELNEAKWTDDFSQLAGGAHAKIRVKVTDGILSASAESAEFIVPFKAPEVFLDPPEWGTSYNAGDEILLEGEASDVQDDLLPDDKLVWTSNLVTNPIGKGGILVIDTLPPGNHTITLTATNSAGLKTTKSLTVSVNSTSSTTTTVPSSSTTTTTMSGSSSTTTSTTSGTSTTMSGSSSTTTSTTSGTSTTTTTLSCYTYTQLIQAVTQERLKWDIKGDNKIGLEEAINALQVISGLNKP